MCWILRRRHLQEFMNSLKWSLCLCLGKIFLIFWRRLTFALSLCPEGSLVFAHPLAKALAKNCGAAGRGRMLLVYIIRWDQMVFEPLSDFTIELDLSVLSNCIFLRSMACCHVLSLGTAGGSERMIQNRPRFIEYLMSRATSPKIPQHCKTFEKQGLIYLVQ